MACDLQFLWMAHLNFWGSLLWKLDILGSNPNVFIEVYVDFTIQNLTVDMACIIIKTQKIGAWILKSEGDMVPNGEHSKPPKYPNQWDKYTRNPHFCAFKKNTLSPITNFIWKKKITWRLWNLIAPNMLRSQQTNKKD